MVKKKISSAAGSRTANSRKRVVVKSQEADIVEVEEVEPQTVTATESPSVNLPNFMTVAQLAEVLRVTSVTIVKQLMRHGIMANVTQLLDYETMSKVVAEFGLNAQPDGAQSESKDIVAAVVPGSEQNNMSLRPPIVTILGHVDHGKTSLLDAIRATNVVDKEVGGITQSIGAYQIEYNDQKVTFIDTPGHEAFTAMRARGANVTDIVVLVVAADDGVMPQTVEAINHALAAKVPIVVAINKIDKADADLDKVKRQLVERDIVIEEWGGDTIVVPVSAKEGTGVTDLLETLLLVAEVADLRADWEVQAAGVVVEAELHHTKGSLATVLVQSGTLHVGDHIVVAQSTGRIKAMTNDQGIRINEAGPSTPVEIMGLDKTPSAGDSLEVVSNDKSAKTLVQDRISEESLRHEQSVSLSTLYAKISAGKLRDLALIIKSDTQGSLEAICDVLATIETEQGQVKIIHSGSGGITESDVALAVASNALIVGFNVRADRQIEKIAQSESVEVRYYRIIYELVEDLQKALEGLLEPTLQETTIGNAEVRQVFTSGKRTVIAGCYVTEGKVTRASSVRVIRDGQEIFNGTLKSLKRFKDDAREVSTGYECGIRIDGFDEVQESDTLSFFIVEAK